MNAHRGDLPAPDPYARPTDPTAGTEAKRCEGLDQDPFKSPKVEMYVAAMLRQIEDRVAHQLARAVIRNVAPALHVAKLNPPRGKRRFLDQQMSVLSAASERDHRGMLEEQEQVPHPALDTKRRQTALELERLTVRGEA